VICEPLGDPAWTLTKPNPNTNGYLPYFGVQFPWEPNTNLNPTILDLCGSFRSKCDTSVIPDSHEIVLELSVRVQLPD